MRRLIACLLALMLLGVPLGAQYVGPPRDKVLDVITWLRGEVYPGIVGHDLDDEGLAAWVVDRYVTLWQQDQNPDIAARHEGIKHRLFAEIWRVLHPEPVPSRQARRGVVRLSNRAFADDEGEFNGLGVSLFWALNGYRTTRDQLERNLAFAADDIGADYIRVLAMVGRLPAWQGRTVIAPGGRGEDGEIPWPDYWQQVEGLSRLAYDTYGLRIEWTLFADADQVMPSNAARREFVRAFAAFLTQRGLAETVIHYEIANEYWQNGFGGRIADMRELARIVKSVSPNLVALSAPQTVADDEPPCDEIAALHAGSVADLITQHFARIVNRVDGYWRPVRQPWEWNGCPGTPAGGTDNERIGPGSSVAADDDPVRVVGAQIYAHMSGLAGAIYHSEAGIWGGIRGPANLYDHVAARDIARALKASKRYLPPGLANWSKQNHHWPGNPFSRSFTPCDGANGCPQLWVDGRPTGVVRAIAAVNGSRFLSYPMGIRGHVDLIADREAACDVLNTATGDVVKQIAVGPNRVARLEGLPAFLLTCQQ